MLKFNYKLTVKERVKAKCPRHPRYNPERDGRGGIIGAWTACYSLYDLLEARNKLDAAVREFVRRAGAVGRRQGATRKETEAASRANRHSTRGGSCVDGCNQYSRRFTFGPIEERSAYGLTASLARVDLCLSRSS